MSYCDFLTSLILTIPAILVEYRLMTCLPKSFRVFSPFSFTLRCLYSDYVLLITSLLALSTILCVHLYSLPLSMAFFNSSSFLCCSMPSFGVSTMSLKNSLFNVLIISHIFIKCQNRYHMKNTIRYKANINNASVIIFLIESWLDKTPSDGTCLGEPPGNLCDVGCCF